MYIEIEICIKRDIKNIGLLIKAYKRCKSIMLEFKPDVVIGVGGYVTLPVIKAASSLGIPTVIHEQNSISGKTNKYLGNKKVNVVIANNGFISKEMAERYHTLEQKDPVLLDREELEKLNIEVIGENFVKIEDNKLRHDVIKVSLHIFSYLL